MAVAVTPSGSHRWTEITVLAGSGAMWLVPARPGAAIDWASDRWLDALDDATVSRIVPPTGPTACPARATPETAEPWTTRGTTRHVAAVSVQMTAEAARAYAAERGYSITPALDSRITALYEAGWVLVALEIPSSTSASSSRTLRVSDDGGAVLPLSVSGRTNTRLTIFTIGAGVASLPGTRDVDPQALRWGPFGSMYAEWRRTVIDSGGGATWLRESSSHDAIFDETQVGGVSPVRSVIASYFGDASCTGAARSVSSKDGVVGTSCAPGVAARVPGSEGIACTPSSGSIDPSVLSCFDKADLALALSGSTPKTTVVTRWAGAIPAARFGANLTVDFDRTAVPRGPVIRAETFAACDPSQDNDAPLSAPPRPSSPTMGASTVGGSDDVPSSDSCGGTTTGTAEREEAATDETTTESCSGGGSSSSDGWDDGDSGEGCSSDDSSSSSTSDSCSGGSSSSSSSSGSGGNDDDDGWDTGDDDDGWDTEDEMRPKGAKAKPVPHAKARARSKKASSPVSRYALLAVAVLLPLRRRRRDRA